MKTFSGARGRVCVKELDKIIGIKLEVLDDGFVRVIDYMGTDESIVQAARVSYGKGSKIVRDDRRLIRYLMRNRHTSPFEMCEIKLHVRVPMDCWRQWIRHRTANVNEYSTRYSIAIDTTQKTRATEWRMQSIANRQGSGDRLPKEIGLKLSEGEQRVQNICRDEYNRRLKLGVAREQARKDLPLSTYTEAYWKIDLHNLLHFLELRCDVKAQKEIREYANIIERDILRIWCPITWEAFQEYRRNSIYLSKVEQDIIVLLMKKRYKKAIDIAKMHDIIRYEGNKIKRSTECVEIEERLQKLGLSIPW